MHKDPNVGENGYCMHCADDLTMISTTNVTKTTRPISLIGMIAMIGLSMIVIVSR